MQFEGEPRDNNTDRTPPAGCARSMPESMRLLIALAILANPAAGWAGLSPVPSQDGPGPSGRPVVRTAAGKHGCVLSSRESAEGHRLIEAGHFAEAGAKLQAVLEAVETGGGPERRDRACLMTMIGMAELQQLHLGLALRWFERALELKPLPDGLVALLTGNLASVYSDLNQLGRAEELVRQAINLYAHAFGPDDPETLIPQATLAFIYVARGEYASAEPIVRRVLYQAERAWSPTSYEIAVATGNLGFIYLEQGKYAPARKLFERALTGLEISPMRAKDEIPLTQAFLAVSCAAGGRRQQAKMWLERALAYATTELSTEDPSLALILERGAMTQFFLKDYDSGSQLFERVITLLEEQHGRWSQPVQGALERYSSVLRKARDKSRAGQLKAQRKQVDARLKALL
jgi:tetratricopeptide (TPR) repeat protein